ncbi:hypothetical protein WOLCODRAFT_139043 [Wolfiporia cocos MD-104 SS10]|uniref:NTF2 domain-containing protein n=1 Tax=Wolfiporia cocos (strain MD-104) TaxID=742152 RepID=A0A2H3K2Z8_WOLCO|nr:hypothetical protein WOLCODRAFT_139043 [Wolfiporia cocos MD-104 SS10]
MSSRAQRDNDRYNSIHRTRIYRQGIHFGKQPAPVGPVKASSNNSAAEDLQPNESINKRRDNNPPLIRSTKPLPSPAVMAARKCSAQPDRERETLYKSLGQQTQSLDAHRRDRLGRYSDSFSNAPPRHNLQYAPIPSHSLDKASPTRVQSTAGSCTKPRQLQKANANAVYVSTPDATRSSGERSLNTSSLQHSMGVRSSLPRKRSFTSAIDDENPPPGAMTRLMFSEAATSSGPAPSSRTDRDAASESGFHEPPRMAEGPDSLDSVKHERSPSPELTSGPRLITEGSIRLAPLPESCKRAAPNYQANRKSWVHGELEKLRRLKLTVVRCFTRDDGMVIDWQSPIPVMSDTLRPLDYNDSRASTSADVGPEIIDVDAFTPSVEALRGTESDVSTQLSRSPSRPTRTDIKGMNIHPFSPSSLAQATLGQARQAAQTAAAVCAGSSDRSTTSLTSVSSFVRYAAAEDRPSLHQAALPLARRRRRPSNTKGSVITRSSVVEGKKLSTDVTSRTTSREPSSSSISGSTSRPNYSPLRSATSPTRSSSDVLQETTDTEAAAPYKEAPGAVISLVRQPRELDPGADASRELGRKGRGETDRLQAMAKSVSSSDEADELEAAALAFLRKYILSFDSDRSSLASAYSHCATFTVQEYAPHPSRNENAGHKFSPPAKHCISQGRMEIMAGLISLPDSYRFCTGGPINVDYDVLYVGSADGVLLICYGGYTGTALDSARQWTCDQRFILRRKEWNEEDRSTAGLWPLVAISHQMTVRKNRSA